MTRREPHGRGVALAIVTAVVVARLTAIAHADSLGLGPSDPSSVDPGSVLGNLPTPVAYGLALAAIATLGTLMKTGASTRGEDGVAITAVQPPSRRGEAGVVVRLALAIVLATLSTIALRAAAARPRAAVAGSSSGLATHQVALADVAPSLQATYRELRTAVDALRSSSGGWPEVDALAARGVRPFTAGGGSYRWTLRTDGVATNYLGIAPPGSALPSLLVAIADADARPDAPGESFTRSNGASYRVAMWFRPAGVAAPTETGVVADPRAARWVQIVP